MGFLDTAKEKATKFTELAKKKVDDAKGKRKSGALLTDLGRTVFRQRTGRGEAGDDAAISKLIAELQALEDDGATVLKGTNSATPTNTSGFAPPPKSSPSASASPSASTSPSTSSSTSSSSSPTASGESTTLPTGD